MSIPTPLTELTAYTTEQRRIFIKQEHLGPTGSIKDRIILRMLHLALKNGSLKPNSEIVEASSGNTGVALALAGRELGFNVRIFVAAGISPIKIAAIEKYGACVEKVQINNAADSEIEKAAQYAKAKGAYLFNQFENPFHIEAYKETLCSELLIQLKESGIRIDHFVGGIGSGASLRAVGETLRAEHNSKIEIHAVAPAIYPSDIEGLNPGHLRRQGHFKIWCDRQSSFEKETIYAQDCNAYKAIVALTADSGLSAGPATGACLWVAQHLQTNGNVLLLLTDAGEKYTQKTDKWRNQFALEL